MPQSTNTTRYLVSLAAHAANHDLADTITHVKPPRYTTNVGDVTVWEPAGTPYVAGQTRKLPTLLAWIDSLTGASVRITTDADDEAVHLLAVGMLDDQTATGVVVVLHGTPEEALLRANVTVAAGTPVPVDLLRSLVDAHTAETRDVVAVAS